jgi:hypothetical protein
LQNKVFSCQLSVFSKIRTCATGFASTIVLVVWKKQTKREGQAPAASQSFGDVLQNRKRFF